MSTGAAPPRRRGASAAALAMVAAALAGNLVGCTAATGTRAGGEPPPVTLRIGTDDPEGRPSADQVQEMARQVAALSDGRVVLEPVYRVNGTEDVRDWDQKTARLVMEGELDLALVPARAWDTEGVDSTRALQAPFLVVDDEHMTAVVSDEDLTSDLLIGLDEVGVTGLALLPEGLRHLFALRTDEVTGATFEGAVVRAPRSETTWALLEALGAQPTDAPIGDTTDAVESEFALAGSFPADAATIGNLTLFPKVNTLVVNTDRFVGLDVESRQMLRAAALATRDRAVTDLPDDAAMAAGFCEGGGTIVLLDAAQLAAVHEAGGPVTKMLRRDRATAALMDRITALADSPPQEQVKPCGDGSGRGGVTAEAPAPDGGELPDGTYRVEFTDEYLASSGLTPAQVQNNHGVWTFALDGGRWTLRQVAEGLLYEGGATYRAEGADLYWTFSDDGGTETHHLRWRVDEAGRLLFEPVAVHPDALFHFSLPWTPVE